MGSKKGGGARTPYEAPNTLNSAQNLRIIDAICEGEIAGFANGDDAPFKSIYFDDTPVQNPDNSFNFKGVTGFFQAGTPDQSYLPTFDATERTVSVGANVKHNTPIVRAISDNTINRLRVTVGVERNLQVKDNGDSVAANTQLVVELINHSGVQATRDVVFNEKGSGAFYHDVLFDVLPAVPFNLRVRRVTPDSTNDKTANNTFFASFVEIIDVKMSYPYTALAALKIDSDQFGNQIPRRNYLIKGKLVQVPSNYNPETRQYSGSLWDGSFKMAWSNNPAWVFYDLLTNPRYSTLAKRLTANDIDKWALYQVAKYCDELVPDGFGGQEPRFVCNAYITDLRQAADLLNDLASVFCGLVVWNGNQISVLQDKHSDPVAHYGNGNVKDGKFDYASAQMKAIHTAVHVKYSDKHDGYRAKVEYIADNQAIVRYGLNVKQVTAFGCDSRGQAARFGAWILQTELKQQHTITFTVGREGLKHLPYDIIRIADNHYAGAEISGRIVAVSGNQITLDREIKNAVGAMWFYTDTVSGSLKSVKIAQQSNKTQIRLESQINVQIGAFWAMSGRVKPRLYRAMSVKENTNDGTYTITALLHDAEKYGVIDESAVFDNVVNTLHGSIPELHNAAVFAENGGLRLSWDNLTADGDVLDYDIKLYKNNVLYRHIPNNPTAEIRFENLPNGDYRAEIRGRNARGVYSKPLIKAWQINYEIKGLRANPKTLAIELVWTLPEILTTAAHTEIWYAKENNFQAAQKLSKLPAPQNSYTLTGVGVLETYYFWARLVDENGNSGEFTAVVVGKSDPNPAPIVAHIQGAITKTELSQALLNQFKADDLAAENRAKAAAAADAANKVAAEATARAAAIRAEATARADSIRAETTARTAAIQNAADNQAAALRAEAQKFNTAIANAAQTAQSNLNTKAAELTQKATELGNRITQTETVNTQQAQIIQTVTTAQSNTAAALEAEKVARANGDLAESQARETLAAKVQQNTAAIASEREARTTAQTAETRAREALATRVGNAETAINAERTARTTADQAQTAEINAAKSRIGTAESSLNALQRTVSEQNRALSEAQTTLTAKLDNLQVGARNLLLGTAQMKLGSGRWQTATFRQSGGGRLETVDVADSPVSGVDKAIKITSSSAECGFAQDYRPIQSGWFTLSAWLKGKAGMRVRLQPFWSNANQNVPTKIIELPSNDWVKVSFSGENRVNGAQSLGYFYLVGNQGDNALYVLAPKLETGNVATDWSPAPEDVEGQATAIQAELTAHKSAQAEADRAQTAEIQAAKSQMNQNKSAIDSIRSTKADKTEVASLARTTLQSEWRSDVNAAKNQSATDAQAKADAAKVAAITAADTAATAKANAAKSAAIAEAANTATAKAEAAKAAAIADAAAKDAVLKQQAATDAQTKADAAKNAAIAEATRLNTATTAKITSLEQAVTNNQQSIATEIRRLTTTIEQNRVSAELAKASVDGNVLYVAAPDGGGYTNAASAATGAIKIRLPQGGTNTMLKFTVEIFYYAMNNSVSYEIAGYSYSARWFNVTAIMNGRAAQTKAVRFGKDAEKYCVWIGELDSTWSHLKVRITNLVAGYSNYEVEKWQSNWQISLVTEFDEIHHVINTLNAAKDAEKAIADVIAERTARVEADNAHTRELNTAKSQIGTAQSEISSLKTTVANNQQTATTQINSLNSKMGTAEANIRTAQTATATLDGKVQTLYTLKTETVSGGKKVVAGLSVGADGASGESQFNIHANKFAVWDGGSLKPVFAVVTQNGKTMTALSGDLIAEGTILGKHLAASQTINAPNISGGVISGSVIRGARMEAVDLEATNIIGDVVAARTFAVEENRLICRIGTSRKTSRTVVVPQILAVAENGETVVLSLWLNGVKQSEKTLTSPTKNVHVRKRVEHTFHTPTTHLNAHIGGTTVSAWIPPTEVSGHIPGTRVSGWVNGGTVSGDIPGTTVRGSTQGVSVSGQIHGTDIRGVIAGQPVLLDFEIPIDIPYTTPKTGGIAYSKAINGQAHTLEILCTINNNRDLRPLGDVSGVVCFVI